MRKAAIQELTLETFSKYGYFANLINPDAVKLGSDVIEFYRDMVPLELGGTSIASLSTCRVLKRPPIVDITEFHTACAEGALPLDADTLMHVGIATPHDEVPVEQFEIFRVPRGTLLVLKAGVWHHAPFVFGSEVANVLIILPERTYANDCQVYEIPPADQIEIIGA